jgi:hypothetical protein
VLAGSSSYMIGSSLVIPMAEVDVVDEDGPTGRARMCCRSKPTGEQRQATRGAGRRPGLLVGPGPSVNSPGPAQDLVSKLLGVPPDLVPDQESVEVILVSFLHAQTCLNISSSRDRLIG